MFLLASRKIHFVEPGKTWLDYIEAGFGSVVSATYVDEIWYGENGDL